MGDHPGEADRALGADGPQGVAQSRRSDEFDRPVDAVRDDLPHLPGDLAVVDHDMVHPELAQALRLGRIPGGGHDRGSEAFRQQGRGHADRGGPAPEEQGLAGPCPGSHREGPVRRLQHFRDRTDRLPRQLGFEGEDLVDGDRGVFRVPAVEVTTHAAEDRHDLLSLGEATAGVVVDDAGGLDPDDAGEGDGVSRQSLAGHHLRTVETEGLHPDPHPAGARLGDQDVPDDQDLGRSRVVDDGCAHGGHGSSFLLRRFHVVGTRARGLRVVLSSCSPARPTAVPSPGCAGIGSPGNGGSRGGRPGRRRR